MADSVEVIETKPKRAPSKRTVASKKAVTEENVAPGGEEVSAPVVVEKKPRGRPRKVVQAVEEMSKPERAEEPTEPSENTPAINTTDDVSGAATVPAGPFASSKVARCFHNVVSASDIKIETERMKKLFASDFETSWADFIVCLNKLMAQYKSTVQLTLCCELASAVICSLASEHQIKFVQRMMVCLKVKEKAVRLRAAHLIRLWLRNQNEISEEVHTRLIESLLEAVQDKNPLIRQEIIACMEFLQDPENPDDKVVKALVLSAQHDTVAKVRKTALRVVAPCETSLETFIARTKDESDEVRSACWKELEDRFKLAWFEPEQLNEMFDQGLEDFSASVRSQSSKTLLRWFNSEKRGDVLGLLEAFALYSEEDEAVAFKALDVVRAKIPQASYLSLTPQSCLTRASSLWLRYLCERKLNEEMEGVNSVAFMDALNQMFQVMRNATDEHFASGAFIVRQLVHACASLETTHDPIGRGQVVRALSEALLTENFPASLVEPITTCIRACFVDESQFIVEITTNVVSFLSELSPLDQCRADILKAEQLIEDLTRQRDYASLPQLVAEIESLKAKEKELLDESRGEVGGAAEFNRLTRSTALVCAILRLLPKSNFAGSTSSLLQDLLDTVCVPAVQSPEAEARMYGVEALGLLALRDMNIAKSHGLLLARTFFENVREDGEVRLRALQVMFDLVVQYGKELVSNNDAEFDSLIKYLMSLLEIDREDDVRTIAAAGLTKMLFLGRVAYPGLVQALLIVTFHPSTEANFKLKQTLLAFFTEYSRGDVVLEAAEPLVEAILNPAPESLCEDLPMDKILERLSFLLSRERSLLVDFALILLAKAGAHASNAKLLVRTACGLDLDLKASLEKSLRLKHMVAAALASGLSAELDKVSLKQLDKLGASLGKLDFEGVRELSEEELRAIEALFAADEGVSISRISAKEDEDDEDDDETNQEDESED